MSKTIVTLSFESEAPYTPAETKFMSDNLKALIVDIDNDANGDSVKVIAETEEEAANARKAQIEEILSQVNVSGAVSLTHGSIDVEVSLIEDTED